MTAAFYYGHVTKQCYDGGMAAVGLGVQQVAGFLRNGVVIACENSFSSVTLAGECNALDEILVALNAAYPDVSAKRIRVGVAYHSSKLYCTDCTVNLNLTASKALRKFTLTSMAIS